jgi:putative ABC transport system permease protein
VDMRHPRWAKVVRDLTQHLGRSALVVLSIAVGIFAVAVVLGGRAVLVREFEKSFAVSNPMNATLTTAPFDDHVLKRVQNWHGVKAAEGRQAETMRYRLISAADAAKLSDADIEELQREKATGTGSAVDQRTVDVVGIRDFRSIKVDRFTPEPGAAWPPKPGEILLERSAQQAGSFQEGDVLLVEKADGSRTPLRVAGFAHDINSVPAMFAGRITGFVGFDTLKLLGLPESYDQLTLTVAGKDVTRLTASRVAASVRDDLLSAAGVRVFATNVPEPGSHFLGDIFKAVSVLLLALGVLSLGLSAFLVVNTISALMAQQVKQVGIMKAVGGRVAQVMAMYLALVAVLGLFAIAIAIPAGTAAGRWFVDFAAGLLNFKVYDHTVPPDVIAIEVAVGLLVPVLAALFPVLFGARVPVARALRETGVDSASFGHGLVDRALGLIRGLPRPVALSLRNTFLRKGRLLLTLTTLALASAVVMSVFSTRSSILRTVADADATWRYDVVTTFSKPANAAAVTRLLERVQGVKAVDAVAVAYPSFKRPDGSENERLVMFGVDLDKTLLHPALSQGRWFTPDARDEVVLSTDVIRDEPQIRVGDTIPLKIAGEENGYKVVGIVSGQLQGPIVYMDRAAMDEVLGLGGGVRRLQIATDRHDADNQARMLMRVESKLKESGYQVASSTTKQRVLTSLTNELGILVVFLALMAGLLAIVGVIGLTGTMSINVLESTREIGVMRATGAGHADIYRIFITEGIVIGVIAWAIGAVVALPLSSWLTTLLGETIRLPLAYEFSWHGVGLWLATVVIVSGLAALLPAHRASQVSVRDAIAYE